MSRIARIRPAMLGAVVAGGAVGVAFRELLLIPFSAGGAFSGAGLAGSIVLPTATMVANILGSFALGLVVGALGDRHPLKRAFFGTGVLGGFTTYSAFAVQTAVLLGALPVAGIGLALVSVLLGLAAAALGVRLTGRYEHAASGSSSDPGAVS